MAVVLVKQHVGFKRGLNIRRGVLLGAPFYVEHECPSLIQHYTTLHGSTVCLYRVALFIAEEFLSSRELGPQLKPQKKEIY